MVEDQLEQQQASLPVVAGKAEEQPVGVIQLGAVVRSADQLFRVGRPEIGFSQKTGDLVELCLHRRRVEFVVLVEVHGQKGKIDGKIRKTPR